MIFTIIIPHFPQIAKEEVDMRSADDIPAHIIIQVTKQLSTTVERDIRACLNVNGLDRPYEYEVVIVKSSSSSSVIQVCIEVSST